MTTYHQEKVQTAIAKITECIARDPKRAERLLGDVKKWSAEAEREAYARGKADAAPQASADHYRDAVIEALMLRHLGETGNARTDIQQIVSWEVAVALNPAVSSDAQALIDKGRNESAERFQRNLKDPNVVHVNMLRGTIAPITFDQLAHVLGDEATAKWIADRQQRGGDVDERAEFEAEFTKETGIQLCADGTYSNDREAGLYEVAKWAWQARAALAGQPAASAEPVARTPRVPQGWQFEVTHSDGRVWLTIRTPHGASATLSAAEESEGGGPTIATQVLDYLCDALAAHKPDGGDAKDAERWRWLTDDHNDPRVRVELRALFDRLPVMSYSAACAAVDAAIAQQHKGES